MYVVYSDKAIEDFDSASEAIQVALGYAYLNPIFKAEHVERLTNTGRTAWAYGFSTVVIEVI